MTTTPAGGSCEARFSAQIRLSDEIGAGLVLSPAAVARARTAHSDASRKLDGLNPVHAEAFA